VCFHVAQAIAELDAAGVALISEQQGAGGTQAARQGDDAGQ
jgi:hypothetical protein